MSQYDFGTIDPYVVDGVQLAGMLNQWRDAIHSMHRGAARPSYAVPGILWINDSAGASNWVVNVYLGAIGDRPLFTYDTVTGNITWSASASGTLQAAILLAQANTLPSVRWSSTSNPIDQKNWRAAVQNDGSLRFSAYTDAGVESNWIQFNRDGTTTSNPAASAPMRLYNESVLGAAAAFIAVTMPAGAKAIELWFACGTTGSTFNDIRLCGMIGAAADTAVTYVTMQIYNTQGAPATSAAGSVGGQLGWSLSAGANTIGGIYRPILWGSGFWMAPYQQLAQGSAGWINISGNAYATPAGALTGWRLFNNSANTLTAGSFLRCFAV